MESNSTHSEYVPDQTSYPCSESALLLQGGVAGQHSGVQAECCHHSRLIRPQHDAASRRFGNERKSEWY